MEGNLVREPIDRQSNTKQAGETYRWFEDWEKDELISNLVGDISECTQEIQDKMIALAEDADEEYGRRLREGLAEAASMKKTAAPAKTRSVTRTLNKHQNRLLNKDATLSRIKTTAKSNESVFDIRTHYFIYSWSYIVIVPGHLAVYI